MKTIRILAVLLAFSLIAVFYPILSVRAVAGANYITTGMIRQGDAINNSVGVNEYSAEPSVIYEGNPQILTNETKVFKMWYRHGWSITRIYYAESINGLNWTLYSENPILSYQLYFPNVMKYNNVYYLYVSNGSGLRNGSWFSQINRYHSFNGVTSWTNDGIILTVGSVGKWDDEDLGNNFVFVENGTWKMLYEAKGNGTGGLWWTGYATSSDGLSWTRQNNGNAVITSYGGGAGHCEKIGYTYYFWTWGGTKGGGLPTDIYEHYSSDLISWTPVSTSPVFARKGITDEGEGNGYGQVCDCTLMWRGNTVYMWYHASMDGNWGDKGHIKLAEIVYDTLFTFDVNKDRKIDLEDVYQTSKAFGSVEGYPNWDSLCDVNEDGKVNIQDYYQVCRRYGTTY